MQSTEEYLDQLLASVSDEEPKEDTQSKKKHHKSIEELDESELTEEALQKQLALLLGLEVEEDDYADEAEDDFMSQYAELVSSVDTETETIPEPVVMPAAEPVPVPAPVAEPEIIPEPAVVPVVEPEPAPAPEVSNTGVLSADEIAALFASMEAENAAEEAQNAVVEELVAEVKEEPVPVAEPAPEVSDTGVLSADEIAALFASMEADKDAEPVNSVDVTDVGVLGADEIAQEESILDDGGALTREELEELGLGDIVDVLVDGEQEILSESILDELMTTPEVVAEESVVAEEKTVADSEKEIIEIPDFDFGEEVLLDLENIDEMLEATAKLAEQETDSFDADMQAEEDIMSMLSKFEEESVQENMAALEESAKAAEEAVNKAMEAEEDGSAEPSEEEEGGGRKRRKAKKEKVKKEKVKKEKPVKEKKDRKSLKDRIVAFVFEDSSAEENADSADSTEKIPLDVGDELAYIELPKEDPIIEEVVKAKKDKSLRKSKKAKPAKKENKSKDENEEIAAELAAEDRKKAKKKEKPQKPKKAKKVVISDGASEESTKETKRGIGTKGIIATLLVCASILGLILVGTYFLPKQLSLIAARTAFYVQDYEEAALRFMDKELNDSDRILYEKSRLLYGLEERYQQAEIYSARNMTRENLNALLQGVIACNEEEVLANQLGIDLEWKLCKDRFMNDLSEKYGLDAQTVEAICELRNPYYTVAVENILAGRGYDDLSSYGGSAGTAQEEEVVPENTSEEESEDVMEDLLPEEQELLEQLKQE